MEGTATLPEEAAHPWREVLLEEILSNEALRAVWSETMDMDRVRAVSTLYKEGHAEGHALGEARGLRTALIELLDGRALDVSAAEHAQIEACGDTAVLTRWLRQALAARTTEEALR